MHLLSCLPTRIVDDKPTAKSSDNGGTNSGSSSPSVEDAKRKVKTILLQLPSAAGAERIYSTLCSLKEGQLDSRRQQASSAVRAGETRSGTYLLSSCRACCICAQRQRLKVAAAVLPSP